MQIDFSQKPIEVINYLLNKGYELTFDYEEMLHEAHHTAFTVAKITKLDLLKDIHNSLIEAQERGIPFETWKIEIIPTLEKKGWWGWQTLINPKTLKEKTIYIGSRRLKTIFYTNMRVSYNVGRAKHQYSLPDSTYLRYVAILDSKTRPAHRELHGKFIHRDSSFWNKNYPPNGWNCRCTAQAWNIHQIKAKGWEDRIIKTFPNIADKDWAYDVRKGKDKLDSIYRDKIDKLPKELKKVAIEDKNS